MTRRWVLLCWMGLAVACGAPPPRLPPSRATYPGFLADTSTLAPDFFARQRLRGRYADRELVMDVVVQLASQKLTLVGLTPFGSRAFVLEQVGNEQHLEQLIGGELPMDAACVLNDVHRVFFRGFAGPLPDGEHHREEHGELVSERWRGGVLMERRFTRLDGKPEGVIVVTFTGSPAPVIASNVRLDNGWFGYSLDIESVSQVKLP